MFLCLTHDENVIQVQFVSLSDTGSFFTFKGLKLHSYLAYEALQAIAYLNIDIRDGIIEFDRVKIIKVCVKRLHVIEDFVSVNYEIL